jgi:hypothetical protein
MLVERPKTRARERPFALKQCHRREQAPMLGPREANGGKLR